MLEQLMIDNLGQYKEHLELLKLELKEIKEETKKIEKAKKYLEKIGTPYIQVEEQKEVDYTKLDILEKEYKMCKSIIRRYETLMNGTDEVEE